MAARRDIGHVDAVLRAQIFRDLAAISGLASHEEGSANALVGDVDRAYEQMELARRSYVQAGELPSEIRRMRRSLVVPCDTGDARSYYCACAGCIVGLALSFPWCFDILLSVLDTAGEEERETLGRHRLMSAMTYVCMQIIPEGTFGDH